MPASAENRPLTLSSGAGQTVIRDVLVGEVWVGSGQSNMEWGVFDTNSAGMSRKLNSP
jgi:sialate O-acetylesterase